MRVLIPLAVLATAMPSAAGIVVLKNGKTFVGRLDGSSVPACPDKAEDMPETVVMSWPHNGQQGPEGRSTWTFKGHELRWYDVAADAPTPAYWTRYLEEEIDDRWHAARERFRQTKKEKPVELLPQPKIELWKGLEKKPVSHDGLSIHPPEGWSPPKSRPGQPDPDLPADDTPEPLKLTPAGEKTAPWSKAATLALWSGEALEVGDELQAWLDVRVGKLVEEHGHDAVLERPQVKRSDRGLTVTFSSVKGEGQTRLVTLWRVLLRDRATYYATFSETEDRLVAENRETAQRCLTTLKVRGR